MSLELVLIDGSNAEAANRTFAHIRLKFPDSFFESASLITHERVYALDLGKSRWLYGDIAYGDRQRYNRFVLHELPKIVAADHVLLCHRDGFPINPHLWTDDFLKHDVIGAPWPDGDNRVGNGGFCIRSRRFMLWLAERAPDTCADGEDTWACRQMADQAREAGFTFAPLELAAKFSLEHPIPEFPDRTLADCFGFHGVRDRLNLLL